MAYDNDFRSGPRDRDGRDRDSARSRNESDRHEHGGRGFFERAGDEVASWFGDEDAERRREQDDRSGRYDRPSEGRGDTGSRGGGWFGGYGADNRASSDREQQYRGGRTDSPSSGRQDGDRSQRGRDEYRPFAGDYGRTGGPERGWDQQPNRQRGFTSGSNAQNHSGDPHYHEWRQRQIDALDNDYDEYRREHQSKFENDFSGWRTQRQSKREILSDLRDGMEVVGSDEQRIGTVDKIKNDRVILRRNDPDAGGVHRSFSCSLIDRLDGDRLILSQSAEQARGQLQREDRGEAYNPQRELGRNEAPRNDASRDDGPHVLERSFSGTYR